MSELEEVAVSIRDVIPEKMLAQALKPQAEAAEHPPQEYRLFPKCGKEVIDKLGG